MLFQFRKLALFDDGIFSMEKYLVFRKKIFSKKKTLNISPSAGNIGIWLLIGVKSDFSALADL
jgi:hypothetical protein